MKSIPLRRHREQPLSPHAELAKLGNEWQRALYSFIAVTQEEKRGAARL